MASHFKWYPASEEVVVPWNARYSFPSQANKSVKTTPRIPPKNGSLFTPGSTVRLEFPAQGYVVPNNTTISFDVDLSGYGTVGSGYTRFQNGIASIFSRIRLMYGSTPLEDIINANVITRLLNECTTTSDQVCDQTSIAEGLGGVFNLNGQNLENTRQRMIQGVAAATNEFSDGAVPNKFSSSESGYNGYESTSRRRYQIQLPLGLFTQSKLIPTKFMASQLAIELTLASPESCIIAAIGSGSLPAPTYRILNVNLIPEVLEFDASYDANFLRGLQEGGVPIKFSSWHTFIFSQGGGATANLQIQERSRSVKSIFAVIRRSPETYNNDSGTFFSSTSVAGPEADPICTVLNSFQFRIGARYFPASPVICSNQTTTTNTQNNGGSEAFIELQKALNTLGDHRLSTSLNAMRWQLPYLKTAAGGVASSANECDYEQFTNFTNGKPVAFNAGYPSSSGQGSTCFIISTSLETSSGMEISGLNAEEQSDISLMLNWSGAQGTAGGFNVEVYTYYDGMLVLRENNVLELIQ